MNIVNPEFARKALQNLVEPWLPEEATRRLAMVSELVEVANLLLGFSQLSASAKDNARTTVQDFRERYDIAVGSLNDLLDLIEEIDLTLRPELFAWLALGFPPVGRQDETDKPDEAGEMLAIAA